jgi:hypothetical protein
MRARALDAGGQTRRRPDGGISPPPGDNLGAQVAALELRCARLSAQAERLECAAAELCLATDVPDWAKRLLLDALAGPRAQAAESSHGTVGARGRILLDTAGAGG